MLLSLFAESQSQEQETDAAGKGSDNLDDLFDEDDDGDPYIEPEEEEEDDVVPGKSSSAEGDSDFQSNEDLEGKALQLFQAMCAYVAYICAARLCVCGCVLIMSVFVFQLS